jgi:hypothetical protein
MVCRLAKMAGWFGFIFVIVLRVPATNRIREVY